MQRRPNARRVVVAVAATCSIVLAIVVGSAWAGSSAATADTEIDVTLGKPKEYSLKLSASAGKAGEVALAVRNRGKITHEFILLKTPIKAAKLKPRAEEPTKVVEPGFVLELEDIAAKERATVELPLKKGHYVLLCNIEGHYAGGMRADLTLK